MSPVRPRKTPQRPVSKKQMTQLLGHPETQRQVKNVEGCCRALVDLHAKTDIMDRETMGVAVKSNAFMMGSLERINEHGIHAGILQRPVTAEELVDWLHAVSSRQRRSRKPKK